MALTPQSNEAFLREVDEELRRDQLAGFWKRWGRGVIGGIAALLIAFGGYQYWQHRNNEAAGQEGEKLQTAFDALQSGNTANAAAPLGEISQSKRPAYRALAIFTQADLLLQRDDLKGAAAKFAAVAADDAVARPLRDLALVRQTSAEYDSLKPQVVVDRLRSLAVAGNPWFGSAGELVAAAYLRMNRRDLAGTLYGQIARDQNVPESIRQRAVQMAGVLGVDAVAQNEENKAQ